MTAMPAGSFGPPQEPPPKTGPSVLKILAIGCGVAVIAVFAFIAVLLVVVFGGMRSSDAYRTAFDLATHDPRVSAALGTPIEGGYFVTGNIHMDVSQPPSADLWFKLLGAKKEGRVHAVGTREGKVWHYTTLTVTPDGGETIDVLRP
jgi:hypothetical protein